MDISFVGIRQMQQRSPSRKLTRLDLVFSNKAADGNLEDALEWGIHGGMPFLKKILHLIQVKDEKGQNGYT